MKCVCVCVLLNSVFFADHLQGTIGCTPNSVPMVFIVLSRDSWGLQPINTHEL